VGRWGGRGGGNKELEEAGAELEEEGATGGPPTGGGEAAACRPSRAGWPRCAMPPRRARARRPAGRERRGRRWRRGGAEEEGAGGKVTWSGTRRAWSWRRALPAPRQPAVKLPYNVYIDRVTPLLCSSSGRVRAALGRIPGAARGAEASAASGTNRPSLNFVCRDPEF
jgi:hypothetical protein